MVSFSFLEKKVPIIPSDFISAIILKSPLRILPLGIPTMAYRFVLSPKIHCSFVDFNSHVNSEYVLQPNENNVGSYFNHLFLLFISISLFSILILPKLNVISGAIVIDSSFSIFVVISRGNKSKIKGFCSVSLPISSLEKDFKWIENLAHVKVQLRSGKKEQDILKNKIS